MQNLLLKQKQSLKFEDIIGYYIKNQKQDNFKIGLEYERISLDKNSFHQADFNNLFEIIKGFANINGWDLIYDNNTIIGAKLGNSSISLEPGGQFEISLAPNDNLDKIYLVLNNYVRQLDKLGEIYNTKFFAIGNNPKNCYQNLNILNKRRYKIMADYLFKKGKFAPVMMRETAGVQVNVDYKNSIDARRKIKAAILMSPFLTGFFANSPFRGGKLTNYKSIRALAWKYTGPDRCNLFYKDIIDNNQGSIYEQYANYILDVPMIFIVRDNKYIEIEGKITFREFMIKGYKGFSAELDDYLIHQSLCFPDVRLKNCIEIRNHDSQNLDIAVGIGAIYKGILYNDDALDNILDFLAPLNSEMLNKDGFLSAKFGVNYKVKELNLYAYDIVKKILYLAQSKLNNNEQKYLDWLIDLINSKRCIADIILEQIKNKA